MPEAFPVHQPRITNHVGNRVFAADDVAAVVQLIVQHAHHAIHFIGEARHSVGLIASCIAQAAEVSTLARLRALVGHLPDHPLGHVVFTAQIRRHEAPDLLGDVHHDGAGLEHMNRLATADGRMVHQGRHAVIWTDIQKARGELIALADIARHYVVWGAQFLEQNSYFLTVRCGPIMQVKHGACSGFGVFAMCVACRRMASRGCCVDNLALLCSTVPSATLIGMTFTL